MGGLPTTKDLDSAFFSSLLGEGENWESICGLFSRPGIEWPRKAEHTQTLDVGL